jgi:hypothetical protein
LFPVFAGSEKKEEGDVVSLLSCGSIFNLPGKHRSLHS